MKQKKSLKNVVFGFVLVALSTLLIACGGESLKSITLSESAVEMEILDEITLTITTDPIKEDLEFDWTSSDDAVAVVNNGVVKALSPGSATITVKALNKEATVSVTVKDTKHNVIFNTDGGTAISTMSVQRGTIITKPEDPKKEGYDFLGWFKQASLATAFDFSQPILGNTTIYAGWDILGVQITFEVNGGTEAEPIFVSYGSELLELDFDLGIEKEGHNLVGWFLDAEFEVEVEFGISVIEPFTVYAKWEPASYSVTFVLNYDETWESQTLLYGEYLNIEDPIREGFELEGWYTDEEMTIPFDPINDPIVSDVTLYVKWKYGQSIITFQSNGGSLIAPISITTNEVLEEPTPPTRNNYLFDGWYSDIELQTKHDFSKPVLGSMTLYAYWIYDPTVGVLVEFELNGGIFPITQTDFFINYGRSSISSFSRYLVYNGNPWTQELYEDYVYVNPYLATGTYWVKVGINRNAEGLYEVMGIAPSGTIENKYEYVISAWPQAGAPYTFANGLKIGDIVTITGADITALELGVAFPTTVTIHAYAKGSGYSQAHANVVRKGTDLPIPYQEGKTFAGWYSDAEFTSAVITKANDNGKLYAKWV